MSVSMFLLWKITADNQPIHTFIILSIVVKIAVIIQFPHNSDMHRYIWEGEIQLSGFNPFIAAPDSPELAHLKNDNWNFINNKHLTTIYWPCAQLLFRLLAAISPSGFFFKLVFLIFDIGSAFIIIKLLRYYRLAEKHIILYILNPFVLIYFSGEGHLDIVMVFWVVLTMYLYMRKKYFFMFLALGIAVMIKVTPLILLPFLVNKKSAPFIPAFLIPFFCIIPYFENGFSLLTVPVEFILKGRNNGLLYSFLRIFTSDVRAFKLCISLMSSIFLSVFFITPNTLRAIYLVIGTFLLCSPICHPWYIVLITPFLPFFRSPGWLYLHASTLLLVFYYHPNTVDTLWNNRPLLYSIEYIPFLGITLWYILQRNYHWPARFEQPHTISVIIPTLNEEKNIEKCIKSIKNQNTSVEILIVDGGSTDNTLQIAQSIQAATLIQSKPGRGTQIMRGIYSASGDIIIIVHADTLLTENSLSRLLTSLKNHPEIVGGSFGALYQNHHIRFRITECMNNMRSIITGISFGDQAQFFRKNVLQDTFPALKLMEDIELSYRMKEKGSLLFIPKGVYCSDRTWVRKTYLINFIRVLFLSCLFIVHRRFVKIDEDCEYYYKTYYGKKTT